MSFITETGRAIPENAPSPEHARLTLAMRQLQGVFVQELFKAMRETVPDEGVISGGSPEQMFTSMLDESLSALVPESWKHERLDEALLRQFRDQLPTESNRASHIGSPVPTSIISRVSDV